MCGRFACNASPEAILKTFQISVAKIDPEISYNIAPTQTVLAVVQNSRGTRGLVPLKWGLIPGWASDPRIASKMINARSESAYEKPAFKDALSKRRCLIVNTGFYEWKKGSREPYFIHCKDQALFAFAGLYEFWKSPEGQRIDTCTILTTDANPTIAEIHQRMPVILKPQDHALWLDKSVQDPQLLQAILQAYPAAETNYYPVSQIVNNVHNNSPECLTAQEHPAYTVQESFLN